MPDGAVPAFEPVGIDCVIKDDLRFKKQLRIGEDAYFLLRAKKSLGQFLDAAGAGATGAGIAKSGLVAGALFAPAAPTGVLGFLGLAAAPAAVTPVGWVIAAAVVAGGGYYGVSRWLSGAGSEFVEAVPKYINTPIDVLGARLMDLLGSLAVRVSRIDGRIDPLEIEFVADHFVDDWGYDRSYVEQALAYLCDRSDELRVRSLARELARFQAANPDCNAQAMQAELTAFLRELITIDGVIDEREELALEAIERVFAEERAWTLENAGKGLQAISGDLRNTIWTAAANARSYVSDAVSKTDLGRTSG